MNLDVYTMLRLFQQYQEDVKALFSYLNGRINKTNICTLNILYYSGRNYAQFQYPNIVTVFLGSIISDFYFAVEELPLRDRILTVLSIVMAHELYHADQHINPATYKKDIAYCNNVENAAEYNAEKFCMSHKREMEQAFGFTFSVGNIATSPYGEYHRITIDDYYGNLILGTFRSFDIYNEFTKYLSAGDCKNLWLHVIYKDYDSYAAVKKHGRLIDDTQQMSIFASTLEGIRRGIASCNYTMMMYAKVSPPLDDSGTTVQVFTIEITNMNYCPFIFD